MNRNHMFKRLALSTLMLSAIAAPAAANAETADSQQNQPTAQAATLIASLQAVPSIAAAKLADPLALAKEYAPDTVKDWEQTLEKYEKIVGKGAVPLSESTDSKQIVTLSNADSKETLAAAIVVSALPAEAKPIGDLKDIKIMGDGTPGTMITATATLMAVETQAGEDSFFQGQIDLDKAAQTKDAEAIKTSLAKLLKLYNAEIEKLEQAK